MSAQMLERSVLEAKDREQLMAIATALGIKSVSRAKKADLIGKIIEQAGGSDAAPEPGPTEAEPAAARPARSNGRKSTAKEPSERADQAPLFDDAERSAAEAPTENSSSQAPTSPSTPSAPVADEVVLGPDGEPLAEWEIALLREGGDGAEPASDTQSSGDGRSATDGRSSNGDGRSSNGDGRSTGTNDRPARTPGTDAPEQGDGSGDGGDGDGESRSRRRRRRRGRNRDGDDRGDRPERTERNDRNDRPNERNDRAERDERDEPAPSREPVRVEGYLDLRDEGYGFLRANGYLPSRDDAYVSVKQTRQFGLRKGDFVLGVIRPAQGKEKNPALQEVLMVNGQSPEQSKNRPRFEDLTPLFPDEKLHLSNPAEPSDMTARIIDLVAPIGKGQRGIIVSPPKAGKTTVMKTIATAIERNNPEVKLIVLLIDERPEEVTDMRRTVKGEVIASTFDRPSDEHTHTAELVIEKAKRLVERGEDVVIILDGITRLSRAYNLAAPASGRIMSGGIDAGALYPPKKFFGAARNIEEGGSLTILATALVETNSRMDDAIFEEFKGTGNMELRLDRKLAERRVYPAIDVDASSTRHEELLFDRKQLQMVWKLRRVLSGLAADGNAAPGLELLVDRLKTFRTNDEFLAEIAKQPSM
ncbi:MAG: transcription termination factor Rho [Ilumatobacteraceae bacterium]